MKKQTKQARQLAEHYADQLSGLGPIKTRPLFGAVALYLDEHVFAMVWEDSLYFKVCDASRAAYQVAGSNALTYVAKGHEQSLKSYWKVPVDVIEDRLQLLEWARHA